MIQFQDELLLASQALFAYSNKHLMKNFYQHSYSGLAISYLVSHSDYCYLEEDLHEHHFLRHLMFRCSSLSDLVLRVLQFGIHFS